MASTWPELHAGTNFNYVWDTGTLEWVKETQPGGSSGGGDGAIVDGVSAAIKATVFDYTSSNPLAVSLRDTNGDPVSVGGGTQYSEDTPATAAEQLTMAGVVRNDTRGSLVNADGDRTELQTNSAGDLRVDGSAVTQPVSAASLPLPTGAATSALQTQPGVDIGDVTINNAAGASAVNIQDGGNAITVDGAVSATVPESTLSTNNSTTATLGGSGVFTGTGDDVSTYRNIAVTIFADQSSAIDGVSFQWSSDNANWDVLELSQYAVKSATWSQGDSYILPVRAQYFRVVYTNGTSAQGTFRLSTLLSKGVLDSDRTREELTLQTTLTALNSEIRLPCRGFRGAVFAVTGPGAGTFSATLVAEAALTTTTSALTWLRIPFLVWGSQGPFIETNEIQAILSGTVNQYSVFAPAGAMYIRVRVSAYTSGSAACSFRGVKFPESGLLPVWKRGATLSSSTPHLITGGQNTATGLSEIFQVATATPGASDIGIITREAARGQGTMAASIPVVLASDQSSIPVTGPLTDTQLRASAVPVSAAALPLPSGAATEATLAVGGTNKTLKRAVVSLAATGDVIAAVGGKRLKAYHYALQARTDGVTVQFRDGAAGGFLGLRWGLNAREGASGAGVDAARFLFGTTAGNALQAVISGGTADIEVSYWDDDAS